MSYVTRMILFISLQWLLSLTKSQKWYAHYYMYLHTWTSLEWDFFVFYHFLRSSMSQKDSLSWDSSSSMRFLSIQCCLNLMMMKHIKWLRETMLSFGSIYWRSFLGCSCLEKQHVFRLTPDIHAIFMPLRNLQSISGEQETTKPLSLQIWGFCYPNTYVVTYAFYA